MFTSCTEEKSLDRVGTAHRKNSPEVLEYPETFSIKPHLYLAALYIIKTSGLTYSAAFEGAHLLFNFKKGLSRQ